MNRNLLSLLLSGGLTLPAWAETYLSQSFDASFPNGGAIPDGTANGWYDTRSVTGPAGAWHLTDLRVSLTLSGGANGDLYAFLAHDGGFTVLLNRVGVGATQGDALGYSNSGMQVTFADQAANGDIHWYGGGDAPSGNYVPDSRNIDPLSPPEAFDHGPIIAGFTPFKGLDPEGTWTLFVADLVDGGGEAKVLSWGLDIEATQVPEPATNVLLALGLGLIFLRCSARRASPSALRRRPSR
jgi:hypothetical protein